MTSEFILPPRQTFTTSTGNTYSYIHSRPFETSSSSLAVPAPAEEKQKPTLLFLHGFPSHIPDWTPQIAHFSQAGYGILAPDLLGYGASSTPTSPSAYRLLPQCNDLIALLDHLNISSSSSTSSGGIIGIGHDTGATLLTRLATYFPDRLIALICLSVGPSAPGTPFDLDSINNFTKHQLGHELLGYINFLARHDDASDLLSQHASSAMSLIFCADPEEWTTSFRPLHKFEEFVRADRHVALGEWYTPNLQRAHLEAFSKADGYRGACLWYRMWDSQLFLDDEIGYKEFKIGKQPVLLIVGERDGGEMARRQHAVMLASWVVGGADMEVVSVDYAGHWVHLERARETNRAIEEFIEGL